MSDEPKETEKLAMLFHQNYEELAPAYGYSTRLDTREWNPHSQNGKLMIAVAERVLRRYVPDTVVAELVEALEKARVALVEARVGLPAWHEGIVAIDAALLHTTDLGTPPRPHSPGSS